jgi:hypothetical protein
MTWEFASGARDYLASFSPFTGAATAAVVMLLGGLLSKRMAAAPQLAPLARAGGGLVAHGVAGLMPAPGLPVWRELS